MTENDRPPGSLPPNAPNAKAIERSVPDDLSEETLASPANADGEENKVTTHRPQARHRSPEESKADTEVAADTMPEPEREAASEAGSSSVEDSDSEGEGHHGSKVLGESVGLPSKPKAPAPKAALATEDRSPEEPEAGPKVAPNRKLDPEPDAALEAESTPVEVPGSHGRGGDEELGVSVGRPSKSKSPAPKAANGVTSKTTILRSHKTVADGASRLPEAENSNLRSMLLSPTAALGILALLSMILLFVYYHVLGIISDLAAAPAGLRYIGYAGLAALLAVIVAFALRLVYLWARLRKTPSVRHVSRKELSERRSMREAAKKEQRASKEALYGYLEKYPKDPAHDKLLKRLGMGEGEIQKLYKERKRLLNEKDDVGPEVWVRNFQRRFATCLEVVAYQAVKRRASLVGLKTAAVPNSILDMLIATHGAFAITGDVCRLYNLRTGAVGTGIIMAQAFANVYLAGRLEDFTDGALDVIIDEQASLVAQVLGKVSTKVAEGAANGILLYRLGKSVIRLVQPIQE